MARPPTSTSEPITRLRILVSAYACEPGKGSEPEVGWQWAWGLARHCDVTVLTRSNNRAAIEGAQPPVATSRPQFIYYDLPLPLQKWKRRGLPVGLYYFFWQIGAALTIRRRKADFDLLQHLTFNSFLLPGFLWFQTPAVILGPLGGGMTTKGKHLRWFQAAMPMEVLRSCAVTLGAWNPLLLISLATARLILVSNHDTLRRIPPLFRHKTKHLLETAAPPVAESCPESAAFPEGRFLWIGRLEHRKAPFLALSAFKRVLETHPHASLTLIGDGPLRPSLARAIQDMPAGSVHLPGKVPRDHVEQWLRDHTALLFTSIRDTSGNVVLEAMAAGRPVIAFRHQGVIEMLTEEEGLLVTPKGTGDDDEQAFAAAMRLLIDDPTLAERLGKAGWHAAATRLSWPAKWRHILPWFENAVRRNSRS